MPIKKEEPACNADKFKKKPKMLIPCEEIRFKNTEYISYLCK